MAQTLKGTQRIEIGKYAVTFLAESALTTVDPRDVSGCMKIVSHQPLNSVLSMIVMFWIDRDNGIDVNWMVEILLEEYKLAFDGNGQFCIPNGLIEEPIEFDRFIGASTDPSYRGLMINGSDVLFVIFMIRGNSVNPDVLFDELKSSLVIARA